MIIMTVPSIPAQSVRRIHYLVTRVCYFNYPLSFTFLLYISLLSTQLAFWRAFCYREKVKEQGNPMTSAACRVTDNNLFKGKAWQGKGRTGKGQGRVGKVREGKTGQGKMLSTKLVEGNQRSLNSVIPFFREIYTVLLPQCPALVFPLCLTLLLPCQSWLFQVNISNPAGLLPSDYWAFQQGSQGQDEMPSWTY